MSFPTIADLNKALTNKEVSAVELAQESLKKASELKELNAFIEINDELSLAQAKAADDLIAKGQANYLTGIPMAHKDNYVTTGWKTTAASKMLENYLSPFDASVVEDLRKAGTVNIGKLNLDEFAMGSSNETSYFGPCLNPWDKTRIPGGSSGGSATAVAAGIVPFATATDSGGSIRQPAALCGVTGIKATYGAVSRWGMIAYASSMDQAGIIARHAADLVPALDLISHFDERDSNSVSNCMGVKNEAGRVQSQYDAQRAQFDAAGDKPLTGLRVGVPAEYQGDEVNAEVATAVQNAIKQLEDLGATLVDISLPHTPDCISAYYILSPAEASSNLSRFDGVRFGHRAKGTDSIEELIARSRAEGFGDEVRRRVLLGTYALTEGYYDALYVKAQCVRRLIADDFQRVFADQCDVIVGPVTPDTARKLGDNKDLKAEWLNDIFTLSVNLAGLPAMSLPCGFSSDAKPLPIGLQLIGNYFNEGQLLAIADRYQQNTDWHTRKATEV
ncbi:Asp-tRNA(Asn)/Glu-tRNA(Gln) amidotransferase GatCAB subunit A [Oligella urethralis]|uniref:Asp-tRNA(Asn)/Glu-tRNA(Gln) amidotransferase subunit GatA n=1 Tax=Oligella urethralis TaxID=90245 RepID=UPI000C9AB30C|nr:Asp-tRNA(Asn)/Glu-tRNA(Gln) amidotransferase subunit GatA [Oligella urethralis]PMC17568.1 Asp-tRNA(Asn)/Glu-tRNA(Gln) amidotransferase GatCAB subunit A [Oligella urethralis]